MLSVDEALSRVLDRAICLPATMRACSESLGLVLAEDVASDVDSPPHDKSLVDGFAVRSADVQAGRCDLQVIERVTAGQVPQLEVSAGEATELMTGAPVPAGADAVVMLECCEPATGAEPHRSVRVNQTDVAPGQNIMPRAVSLRRGQTVLRAGDRIRPIEIGLLAEVGRVEVRVIPQPRVAVLATGNELVTEGRLPGPGQIRNSNGPMLMAAALRAGATAIDLGVGRDDAGELERLIGQGLSADVLVVSGGVSAGLLDLVPDVLHRLGVAEVFHKVQVKPGKPLWFGTWEAEGGAKLVFGLPGNAVSSLVTFELFVRPALAQLAGRDRELPELVLARLAADFPHRGLRTTYHPARLSTTLEGATVELLAWRGSGDLATLAGANALVKFPAGDREYAAGVAVEVLILDD